jgi:AhpC/TSA family protein/cytochrome c biogenesis DsbD-like protein
VELQGRVAALKDQKIGLVAISYDSPAILKRFAEARGITYPLLSDGGSAIIKRFGLLNTTIDPAAPTYGIPFPGTIVVNKMGIVTARYFEDAYQERNTVASILVRQGQAATGPSVVAESAQVRVTATATDARVAPGERLSLVFNIEPRKGMHLYAPGAHSYSVVRVTVDAQPWLRAHPVNYPASEIYEFKPLNERVEVYQRPFRLVQDVTILATREVQQQLAGQSQLTLTARLDYQACDDRVCYSPQSIPMSWKLDLTPLDRK